MSGGVQERDLSPKALELLWAYTECSNEVQEGIRELLATCRDPETTDDDRQMMLHTLADALFPHRHEGKLGLDLEQSEAMGASHSEEVSEAVADLDREEETFAARLGGLLSERGITQEELAERIGVGQPAISNMLNRHCRPQRRTVARLAKALEVAPEYLWPAAASSP